MTNHKYHLLNPYGWAELNFWKGQRHAEEKENILEGAWSLINSLYAGLPSSNLNLHSACDLVTCMFVKCQILLKESSE